jgi:DNA-binding beta-propeller fold protein YncE
MSFMLQNKELLRSGFPYFMTLGQRRVTSTPMDIGFGKEKIYILVRNLNLGTYIRVINWEDDNLGTIGGPEGTRSPSPGNENIKDASFQWPAGLLVDDEENLYVTDEAKHSVVVMNKDGDHLDSWGEYGEGESQLNRPSGMSFDGEGNILLSDTMNNRLQRFTKDGKHLQTIGEDVLNNPWGVCVDEDDDIYVADWKNDRVVKFNPDGIKLQTIGSSGSGKGQFSRPSSVAVDIHGDIYVADWQNNRVQLFDNSGKYIQSFHGDATLSKSGLMYIMANPVTLRLREMADFEKTQRLDVPMMVKVDKELRLFITDTGNHRIQVYKKDAIELSEDQIAPPMRNPVLFTT